MKLSSDCFSAFLKVLQIISTGNEYLVIKKNKIRQLSNTKEIIFDCNISPIFESQSDNELDLILKDIEQKSRLISLFYKQGYSVNIKKNENITEFYDELSYVSIPEQILKYAEKTNPVLSDSEFESRILKDRRKEIVTGTLDGVLMERINQYSKTLQAEYLYVVFDVDKATLKISDGDLNNQTSTGILTVDDLELDGIVGVTKFRIAPIIISPAPINFKIYTDSNFKNAVMYLDVTICNKPYLNMNMWFMSPFDKLSDDNESMII